MGRVGNNCKGESMSHEEILQKLKSAVEEMDSELAEAAAREAVEAGVDLGRAIHGYANHERSL